MPGLYQAPADSVVRFLFEHFTVRGEVVLLEESWREVLARARYPAAPRRLLGESLAAVALFAGGVKLQCTVTVQAQGDGPVHLLVVQCNQGGELRGLTRWKTPLPRRVPTRLLGEGKLVITLDPAGPGKRYQGIVSLQSDNLAQAFEHYFQQSEQLTTRLWLAADSRHAAGLLLQQLPGPADRWELAEHWRRVVALTDTLTEPELLGMEAGEVLHRLYHQEEIRVFKPRPLRFHCTCSRRRIESVLLSLGRDSVDESREPDGGVAVNCEFCNQRYYLDRVDLEQLFSKLSAPASSTRQ